MQSRGRWSLILIEGMGWRIPGSSLNYQSQSEPPVPIFQLDEQTAQHHLPMSLALIRELLTCPFLELRECADCFVDGTLETKLGRSPRPHVLYLGRSAVSVVANSAKIVLRTRSWLWVLLGTAASKEISMALATFGDPRYDSPA